MFSENGQQALFLLGLALALQAAEQSIGAQQQPVVSTEQTGVARDLLFHGREPAYLRVIPALSQHPHQGGPLIGAFVTRFARAQQGFHLDVVILGQAHGTLRRKPVGA